MLENLNPNTQYIVFVTAHGKKGKSQPSETLIAWTDPAYPAFVEVRRRTLQALNFQSLLYIPSINLTC